MKYRKIKFKKQSEARVSQEIQVVNRCLQVTQIQSTNGAFAAIKEHGSVVTWGAKMCGGDSRSVQPLLHNVEKIQSNRQLRDDVASVGTG